MKKNTLKALSMTELTVVIVIISIIVTLAITNFNFSNEKVFKAKQAKSYVLLEQIVSQVAKDEVLYSDENYLNRTFQNVNKISFIKDNKTYTLEGKTKFCKAFATKIGTKNAENCENTSLVSDIPSFTSLDDIDWYLPIGDFANGWEKVTIDINSKSGPNCYKTDVNCETPDRYAYYIKSNGTISKEKPPVTEIKHCCKFKALGEMDGEATVKMDSKTVKISTSTPTEAICDLEDGEYILKVTPPDNYLSSIPDKGMKVKIDNGDATVNIRFFKKNYHDINLEVECPESNIKKCISVKEINLYTDSNNVENVTGKYEIKTQGKFMIIKNVPAGNYQLKIKTASEYAFSPANRKQQIEQDVLMGEDDVSLKIIVDYIASE